MNNMLRNVQNVLNNRPLAFCYVGLTTALVANPLIYGHKIHNININDDTTNYDENATETQRSWYVRYLTTLFWKQWQRGYLRELCGTNNKSNLYFKGRYCANRDNNKYNRINWKMSRVTGLIKGKDASIRAANVKYMKNYKKVTIFQPINKLYPVELNNNEAEVKLKFACEKDLPSVKTLLMMGSPGKCWENTCYIF